MKATLFGGPRDGVTLDVSPMVLTVHIPVLAPGLPMFSAVYTRRDDGCFVYERDEL